MLTHVVELILGRRCDGSSSYPWSEYCLSLTCLIDTGWSDSGVVDWGPHHRVYDLRLLLSAIQFGSCRANTGPGSHFSPNCWLASIKKFISKILIWRGRETGLNRTDSPDLSPELRLWETFYLAERKGRSWLGSMLRIWGLNFPKSLLPYILLQRPPCSGHDPRTENIFAAAELKFDVYFCLSLSACLTILSPGGRWRPEAARGTLLLITAPSSLLRLSESMYSIDITGKCLIYRVSWKMLIF